MSKKEVCRTAKAQELKNEITSLYEKERELDRQRMELFRKYIEMEGMYGHIAYSPYDCGHGLRGYHYEYDSEELRNKEYNEREQFLVDNGYYEYAEIFKEYETRIAELRKAFCLEQYGMTEKEKEIRDRLCRYEKELKKAEKTVVKYKEDITDIKKELDEYLKNNKAD